MLPLIPSSGTGTGKELRAQLTHFALEPSCSNGGRPYPLKGFSSSRWTPVNILQLRTALRFLVAVLFVRRFFLCQEKLAACEIQLPV